jgi:septal ring factor EnvC (AmiA/AmiB activator)
MTGVCCKFVPPIQIPTVETPMEAMHSKLDIYEKERAVQNARIETMQQQIDKQNEEQKKIKDKIAVIEHHHTSSQHQKTRDKRKTINKDVRQHIILKIVIV